MWKAEAKALDLTGAAGLDGRAVREVCGVGRATDAALREAGGGRVAGVRLRREYGRTVYAVQFVRGDWLCTATVDAATRDVTSIVNDSDTADEAGAGWEDSEGHCDLPEATGCCTQLSLAHRMIWDVQAATDDRSAAYVATDAGVSVVRLRQDVIGWSLDLEAAHTTGYGSTRQVAAVPGGVVGVTGDGRVFRIDRDGARRWDVRLPAPPYTVSVTEAGDRILVATNAGAVELDADDGRILGTYGVDGPVRAATYLACGDRVLVSHSGCLVVLHADDGSVRWCCDQGEYPERVWVYNGRIYLAGEGGLKEIVVGQGVVCRWPAPAGGAVESAVIADGWVYTCSPEVSVTVHGYATSDFAGLAPGLPSHPEVITLLRLASGLPVLLVADRSGVLSAHRLGSERRRGFGAAA
jgi:hypothetical protein